MPKERSGRAPAWPLSSPATAKERSLWSELWKLPQAIVWEEQRVERAVARYVRMSVAVDAADAPAAKVKTVLDQERTLLLELGSLLRAGYRISSQLPAQPAVGGQSVQAQRRNIPSSKSRLRPAPRPVVPLRGAAPLDD
ncbi:hypothetical protein [Microbacterium sp. A1-JK]|uniref:hypothetical protein n=1 Tax=Microbacterium sp. A1-JK TaxID=3177516 RepID=UPI0038896337